MSLRRRAVEPADITRIRRVRDVQLTMFGTSDIGHWFNLVEGGGDLPWDNPARWVERSPITYAKDIHTPLLSRSGTSP